MTVEVYSKYTDPRVAAMRANAVARAQYESRNRMGAYGQPGADVGDMTVPWHPGQPTTTGWYPPTWQHGRSPAEMTRLQDRFEKFLPRLAGTKGFGAETRASRFFDGLMPGGAQIAPGAGAGYQGAMQAQAQVGRHYDARRMGQLFAPSSGSFGGGGHPGPPGVTYQQQQPYQPENATPDRQSFPVHRNLANQSWRLFNKLDGPTGTGTEMYAELPWGDVEFSGEGVDGEVKDHYERMWERCQVRAKLPYFVSERLITGETGVHCYYDPNTRGWSYIAIHNPDQLEVLYTPFIEMDPVVRFKPDNRLQAILQSSGPMTQAVRQSIPPQLLSSLLSGQPIELSPLNFTFLARKLHPYDVRGTSLYTRMWRLFMLEDRVFAASIAAATRYANALRVAKLGDATTGWIPDPEQEQRLHELLAQAELDPGGAWLVYHYGLQLEAFGTQERGWKSEQSAEFIERGKLIAMGLSKAFLTGEVTYASAASGLTVFLQRLKALREYFETTWILPKFFRPVAVLNQFVKPTSAELAHGVRTRRSHWEVIDDGRYIVPKLNWARPLDPSVESAQIQAIESLQRLGVVFSKTGLISMVGKDYEEELRQRAREVEIEQKLIQEVPAMAQVLAPPGGAGGGLGGGGGGMLPGLPPSSMGFGDEAPMDGGGGAPGGDLGGGAPVPPEASASGNGGPRADAGDATGGPQGSPPSQQLGNWDRDTFDDLMGVFAGDQPHEALWRDFLKEAPRARAAIQASDEDDFWESLEDWLVDVGYLAADIRTLRALFLNASRGASRRTEDALEPEDNLLVGAQ